jgi:hypothetical protein
MVSTGVYCRLPVHHFGRFRGYYKRLIKDSEIEYRYGNHRQLEIHQDAVQESTRNEREVQSILNLAETDGFNPSEFLTGLEVRGMDVMTLRPNDTQLPLDLQEQTSGSSEDKPPEEQKSRLRRRQRT